jgi:hypothetical protein
MSKLTCKDGVGSQIPVEQCLAAVKVHTFNTWLASRALQARNSKKSNLSFGSWEPRSSFESSHALKAMHSR